MQAGATQIVHIIPTYQDSYDLVQSYLQRPLLSHNITVTSSEDVESFKGGGGGVCVISLLP